ncbi:MAG: glucosaminidase domain-containing protein [Treponema sp.]|jgi:hypothetical protein|nr:glucosaminidase domain-containing protein [Treponema sp.]
MEVPEACKIPDELIAGHYHFEPYFNRYKNMKHLLFLCFNAALFSVLFSCVMSQKAGLAETASSGGLVPQNTVTGNTDGFRNAGQNPLPERAGIPTRTEISGGTERPEPVPIPERLMGKGLVDSAQLTSFLLSYNPQAGTFAGDLSRFYVEEAAAEGVNHDVAFAQMCLETGFLHYGNLVTPDMNNFCGLGSIGPAQKGEVFPDPRTGVRAHIQHLKAYATEEPLKQALVDPRYRWVKYGRAPTLDGLAGTWAADKDYAKKIRSILERLYAATFGPERGTVQAVSK